MGNTRLYNLKLIHQNPDLKIVYMFKIYLRFWVSFDNGSGTVGPFDIQYENTIKLTN